MLIEFQTIDAQSFSIMVDKIICFQPSGSYNTTMWIMGHEGVIDIKESYPNVKEKIKAVQLINPKELA